MEGSRLQILLKEIQDIIDAMANAQTYKGKSTYYSSRLKQLRWQLNTMGKKYNIILVIMTTDDKVTEFYYTYISKEDAINITRQAQLPYYPSATFRTIEIPLGEPITLDKLKG